jgi:hypothetical protein
MVEICKEGVLKQEFFANVKILLTPLNTALLQCFIIWSSFKFTISNLKYFSHVTII